MPGVPVKFDEPGEWKSGGSIKCRRCGATDVKYRCHTSSCGGFDDDEFKCFSCLHVWWVDGIDS